MSSFFKNPITIWLKRFLKSKFLEFKNRHQDLKIGYMSSAVNCIFGRNNRILEDVLISNTSLGDFTYIADHTTIQNAQIGKFCCIGPNCNIGLGKHPSKNFVSTHPAFYSVNNIINVSLVDSSSFEEFDSVKIGNDVWIGSNVIIKDGVKIGNGAIIGTGAVVTKDVDDYAIVGGVPAKLIRYRFTRQQIEQLLKTEWWNFDYNKLKNFSHIFEDIEKFILNINKLKDLK